MAKRITKTKDEDRCIATAIMTGMRCTIKRRKDLEQSLCTCHLKEIGFDFDAAFAERDRNSIKSRK